MAVRPVLRKWREHRELRFRQPRAVATAETVLGDFCGREPLLLPHGPSAAGTAVQFRAQGFDRCARSGTV